LVSKKREKNPKPLQKLAFARTMLFFLFGQPNTDKLHLMALKRVGGNVSNTYSLQSTAPTSPERHGKQSQMDSIIVSFHRREDMGYKFTVFYCTLCPRTGICGIAFHCLPADFPFETN